MESESQEECLVGEEYLLEEIQYTLLGKVKKKSHLLMQKSMYVCSKFGGKFTSYFWVDRV